MSTDPERTDLIAPEITQAPTVVREEGGTATPIPTFKGHLMVDEYGLYPVELNSWEVDVLEIEMAREGTFAWYRNPSRALKESLAIAYEDDGGRWKGLRPDFLFFAEANGQIVADIVDPHSHHLADALPKLRGLVLYSREYGAAFRRIEALSQVDGEMKVLDLFNERVRQAIDEAESAEELYRHLGRRYS